MHEISYCTIELYRRRGVGDVGYSVKNGNVSEELFDEDRKEIAAKLHELADNMENKAWPFP